MPNRSPAVVHGSSLRQAYTLTEQGHFTEAVQVLDLYLQEAPQDKRAWVLRAHVMLTMGNPEGALDSIERVTHIDPADPMPWVIQGTALSTMGDYASALHSLENALVADPENRDAHELRRAVMERIQRQEAELQQQQAWYELAELQYRLGRHEEALPNLERSLRQTPSDPAGWGLKACVLWAIGRQEEAVKDIGRSIKLRAEDDWAYGVRGTMLKDLGRYEDALEDINQALSINPQREDLVILRRNILSERQRIPVRQIPDSTGNLPGSGPSLLTPQPAAGPSLALADDVRRQSSDSVELKSRAVPSLVTAPAAPSPAELPLEDVKRVTQARKATPADIEIDQLRRAMEEAHHCYARNDYRAAAALYEKIAHQAASRDKHMAALAWLYRGRCHYALREYEQALRCYDAVARMAPENPSWLEHGLTLRHLGQYQEAIAWFDRCIETGHNIDTAWVQKGHCALHLKRTDEAIDCYRHATETNPGNAHAWLSLAQSLSVEGALQEAYEAVNRGLSLEPRNASGLELLGDILCLLGRFPDAAAAYGKAIELEPQRERAQANVAALRDNPNALPETVRKRYARHREKPARTKEPSDRLTPIRDLLAQSRIDEAWNALESILERGPATPMTLALKASLLSELGRWEDAVAAAGEALRLDPASFEGHYETARALASLKQFQEALAEVEKALQRSPKDPLAWALRGTLNAHLGDAEQAQRSFETAESDGRNAPGVLFQKAMAMEIMGYPEPALELFLQVVGMAPRHAEARAEMAVTLAALGRRQEAWQATQEALKINPYQATALEWSARLRHVAGSRPTTGRLPSPPSGLGSELLPKLPDTGRFKVDTKTTTPKRAESDVTTWGRGQKLEGAPLELLKRARDSYERGEFEQSMAAYDQALRQDPRLAGGWYGKGLCATALWQFEEAREGLERAARLPDPPVEQIKQACKRLDAMQAFQQQSIRPLLARDPRAWRMFTAPSGSFRLPYPSWCQSFPPTGAGELAYVADRSERPTFLFTVAAQPFVDPRELTTVKHGEQVVEEGELPHAQATVEFKEVRDRAKGSFSLRAVLIQGHMAWYLVGSARFHYYAGYRDLFQIMIEEFHLA